MKHFLVLTIILLHTLSCANYAQTTTDSVLVIPGENYEAGSLHRFFLGDNWRKLWTMPVKVPVLNLDTFAGGLTPHERGGGMQTKSLKFVGADGNVWKFRSINKDPSKILPEDVRNSLVDDIVQDQISSSNPFAAILIVPILDKVNILQAKAKIFYMPDSPKLKEFRDDFGGLLGTLEVHPDEGANDKAEFFNNSEKIVNTFSMFEKVMDKTNDKVNPVEFYKARLLDSFLGDWDRHTDQWRWARFRYNDFDYWHPIPRDRDQAFVYYSWIGPRIATLIVPQLNHFDYDYPDIRSISWNGRYLDRRFLPEVSKAEWDSVTTYVYNRITEDVIEDAIHLLPEEQYAVAGEEITEKLKSRRKKIFKFAEKYYEHINEVADINCKSDRDLVKIERTDSSTIVQVYKQKKSGEPEFRYFYKEFDNNITKELRVYLEDGDDVVSITGDVTSGVLIRVIGGKGKDSVYDHSRVRSDIWGVIPLPYSALMTRVYDNDDNTITEFAGRGNFDNEFWTEPATPEEKYEPKQEERYHLMETYPLVNYSDNDGWMLGIMGEYTKYNFRAVPNSYEIHYEASYATYPQSYRVALNGAFRDFFKKTLLEVGLESTQLKFTNYFGYGNNTKFDNWRSENEFYRLDQEYHTFSLGLSYIPTEQIKLGVFAGFYASEVTLNTRQLIENFRYGTYGEGKKTAIETGVMAKLDFRDKLLYPLKGFYLSSYLKYVPELIKIENEYYKAGFDARAYVSPFGNADLTVGFNIGGEKLWNRYPFYDGALLGGDHSLRGYNRERFAGDASLFGKVELRSEFADVKAIIKGRLGAFTFVETGRVFTPENYDKWHPSYGVGMFLSFFERSVVGSTTVAFSPETEIFFLNFGFGF